MVVAVLAGMSAVRTHPGPRATVSDFFGSVRLPSGVTSTPTESWRYTPPEGVVPAAVDHTRDVVVVTTHPTTDDSGENGVVVVALDAHSGHALWSHSLPAGSYRVATTDGLVVHEVADGTNRVMTAFDARTGRARWSVPVGARALPFAVGASADHLLVYEPGDLPGTSSTVRSVRVRDGSTVWSVEGDAFSFAPGVVATSMGTEVRLLDDATGAERWHVDSPSPGGVDFLGVTASVILTGHRGRIAALDPATGSVRWTQVLGNRAGGVGSPLQLAAGAVVVDEGNTFVAVDPASGEEVWRGAAEPGSLLLVREGPVQHLFAVGSERVQSVDPASGKVSASLAATGGQVAFSASGVYAIADDGTLVSASFATLTPSWNLAIGPVRGEVSLMAIDRAVVVLDDAGDVRVYR
jgi:outer membrane protein assembly factor BamB